MTSQNTNSLPVRGFCIAVPEPENLRLFIDFIHDGLAPANINTLILRIDYNYKFKSHPELAGTNSLSKSDVKKLVKACRVAGIRVIPQINLLGHQSWEGNLNNLLKVYPQLDETPCIQMPEAYKWPNKDELYCKSYCPLHPDVHAIVFSLMDEICDAFNSDAFHAGMDEVFYIGHDSCKRCSGRDKAVLFADEVCAIRNHLAKKKRKLWIWGDRLINGDSTGIGMWEASMNQTFRAVDLIPKDVFICDWHYERPEQTPVYFASKGFQVATCTWNNAVVAKSQMNDMFSYRDGATPEMKERYAGIIQTVWASVEQFLDEYNQSSEDIQSAAACFKTTFKKINNGTVK